MFSEEIRRIRSWFEFDYERLLIIVLKVLFLVSSIVCLSGITTRFVYHRFVPQPLLREKLYFDFRPTQPLASLRLKDAQNQWDYVGALTETHRKTAKPAYLIPGRAYDVSLLVVFAKSPRNRELGKVVFTVTLQDITGETIAQSVRTVPYLYRSPYFTVLQDVATFVYELIGLAGYPILEHTYASVMENYVEPSGHPPTNTVNIELSTSAVDLYTSYLVISPKMNFITAFFYHHPWITFFAGTFFLSGIQLWFVIVYYMIYYVSKAVNAVEEQGDYIQEAGRRGRAVLQNDGYAFNHNRSTSNSNSNNNQSNIIVPNRSSSTEQGEYRSMRTSGGGSGGDGIAMPAAAVELESDEALALAAFYATPTGSPLLPEEEEYYRRNHPTNILDATAGAASHSAMDGVAVDSQGLRQRRRVFRVEDDAFHS